MTESSTKLQVLPVNANNNKSCFKSTEFRTEMNTSASERRWLIRKPRMEMRNCRLKAFLFKSAACFWLKWRQQKKHLLTSRQILTQRASGLSVARQEEREFFASSRSSYTDILVPASDSEGPTGRVVEERSYIIASLHHNLTASEWVCVCVSSGGLPL